MKVLVTGGKGFIGRGVVAELLHQGYDPVVFDRFQDVMGVTAVTPGGQIVRSPGGESILGDVRDATAVTEAVAHVDAVIHLAGVLGTSETITNPRPAAETNILGGLNVLEACAQYRTPLVNIAVGNHFEYSTYSITKTTIERFSMMYGRYRDLPVCCVRAYNVYGPGQSVAQPYGSSRVRKVIPSFISRALHGEPIEIYGMGDQIMDMIYITDAARCLVTALGHVMTGTKEPLYTAGTGRRTDVRQIAEAVQHELENQTGIRTPIVHLPMRSGETPGSEVRADPDQVRLLGLDPDGFTQLEDGLMATVTYYRKLFSK